MSKNYVHIDIVDESGNSAMDATTSALKIAPHALVEIHERNSWVVNDVQQVNTTTMQWMVTTSDNAKLGHMFFGIKGTGEIEVTITEGADRIGTNLLTEINRFRDELTENPDNGIFVHRGVSGGSTDGAVIIVHERTGATTNKTVAIGQAGIDEFVLARNTKYIITVETFADIYVTFAPSWHEHTNL